MESATELQVAMVQNQWYHFGIGAPPILVDFSGDWVYWGYGVLAHGQVSVKLGAVGFGRPWADLACVCCERQHRICSGQLTTGKESRACLRKLQHGLQ